MPTGMTHNEIRIKDGAEVYNPPVEYEDRNHPSTQSMIGAGRGLLPVGIVRRAV